MTTHYLSVSGVTQHLGIAVSTASTYLRDKRLPSPDAIVGEPSAHKYGWLPAKPSTHGTPPAQATAVDPQRSWMNDPRGEGAMNSTCFRF